ncbi:MAG: aldehyde dehydrogenase family protein [Pseudomonadota bacterium]
MPVRLARQGRRNHAGSLIRRPREDTSMKEFSLNQTADMHTALARLKAAYLNEPNPSYEVRVDRLTRLYGGLRKYADQLVDAMSQDFSHRSAGESRTLDVITSLGEVHHSKRKLKKWMKARKVPTPLHLLPARSRIIPQPLGVVGIISPWNFPIFLTIPPIATALAAGNRVMLKPSELSPKTSEVLKTMLEEFFSADEVVVITGGPQVAAEFSAMRFDHLLFTGSTGVGRKVAVNAAQNLTPVTLELGGKSPVIVTPSANLDRAADRVAWGKSANSGQICISPDYALVPRDKMGEFAVKLEDKFAEFFPEGTASSDYSAIITERHRDRLMAMTEEARASGAGIRCMAHTETNEDIRKVAPTIVVNPDTSLTVMREEVFGPILSIIPYDTQEEALKFVQERERPLALYIFSEDREETDFWLSQSISGGVCVNEVVFHATVDSLPFGGVGESGMGAYHGDRGFETFSHMKSVFIQPKLNAAFAFNPPHTGVKKVIVNVAKKVIARNMPAPGPKPALRNFATSVTTVTAPPVKPGPSGAHTAIARPWLETYGTDVPAEIDTSAYASVIEIFEHAMETYPDKIAFKGLGGGLSYREVERLSRNFAAYLQNELGVKKGDRVALMCPNVLAFPVAMLGILRAGAAQVNVNPLYTAPELCHQLVDSGAEHAVIFSGSTSVLADIIDVTAVKTVTTIRLDDCTDADLESPPVDERLEGTVPLSEALRIGEGLAFARPDVTGEDLIFLQYTGGTTGPSKGATLTHANLVAQTLQFRAMTPDALRPGEEVVIIPLPMYHIFGLVVGAVAYFGLGAEMHLIADPRDPEQLVAPFKNARFSVAMGVNTLYQALVNHPDAQEFDFSNYRVSIGGGSKIQEAVSNKWKELSGHHILEGYGMSEVSGIATINLMRRNEFSGTVGLPLPSMDVKLLDADGNEVARGEEGEVCLRGPNVMRGYWQKPEANVEAFTSDGYIRSGDIGRFDDKGFLSIVDRKKDMILVSGFNVYPNEIEEHVVHLDGVAECACVGIEDKKSGEVPKLFVVKSPVSKLTKKQVEDHCRKGLTSYKVPKQVEFVEALPKSNVGKILRRELRLR